MVESFSISIEKESLANGITLAFAKGFLFIHHSEL